MKILPPFVSALGVLLFATAAVAAPPALTIYNQNFAVVRDTVSLDLKQGVNGVRYMYHDPCHTPMKTYQPLKVVDELMGTKVTLNDRCCGESGTLATTRPDISTQVRFRKEEEMRKGAAALRADGFAGPVKVLTSCPSCLQGLSRFDEDAATGADYIVVEIANRILGKDWLPQYVDAANRGGIERVLL